MFMLFLLVLVNIGISYWNAKQAGRVWAESKGVGGWIRILVWCAAIQSAVGFTSAYAIILATLAIVLSFAFYIPVVLWADIVPLVGMLMIPKTCAYVWVVWMGFSDMHRKRKETVK